MAYKISAFPAALALTAARLRLSPRVTANLLSTPKSALIAELARTYVPLAHLLLNKHYELSATSFSVSPIFFDCDLIYD